MTKRRVVALVVVIVFSYTLGEYINGKLRELDTVVAPVLKENENQKIIVDTNKKTVTVVRRGHIGKGKESASGTQVVKVTEGARKVVITERTDGTISVVALNKGICFEPGLALYHSDQTRLGLDVQVAYWKRWGVVLGAGVNMGDEPRTGRLHIAVNHALPLSFIDNTTAFIGVDHRKDVVMGLRVRF